VSKAFTKEEAHDEPVVAPRAPLPEGSPNYVTPRGLRLLRAELAEIDAEAARLAAGASEDDERRRLAIVAQRRAELVERIAGAELVSPGRQARDAVRFGATVVLRVLHDDGTTTERRLQIVGVDEADPAQGRVAFTAPIAREVLGCTVGDVVVLETPDGDDEIEVVEVAYEDDPDPDASPPRGAPGPVASARRARKVGP